MDVCRTLTERHRQNETEVQATRRALRSATYALAVLSGHTHDRSDDPFEIFLRSMQTNTDTTELVEWLMDRLNEVKRETGVCANLILALQRAALFLPVPAESSLTASPLDSARGTSIVHFKVFEAMLQVLHSGWSHEDGIPVYVTVFSALLDEVTRRPQLLKHAIIRYASSFLIAILSINMTP